jgi:hypothetical protein
LPPWQVFFYFYIMMRKLLFLFLLAGCAAKEQYDPDKYLSPVEKDSVMNLVIRYVAETPKGVDHVDKFNPRHEKFYKQKISEARLEKFYEGETHFYFLISQPAPSLTVKRHATGGWFVIDDDGKMSEYREVFRTWKMIPDTLQKRATFLFDKMVQGENLEPYHTRNSNGIEYIEFPDDRVYYDEDSRQWKAK